MNPCMPEWNLEGELHVPSQKKPFRTDEDGLVELLWENGQVVLHSQIPRKQGCDDPIENRLVPSHDNNNNNNPSNLIEENDTVSWVYGDDPFEKNHHHHQQIHHQHHFCSDLFPLANFLQTEQKQVQHFEETNDKLPKFDSFHPGTSPLPSPRFQAFDSSHYAALQDIAKGFNFQPSAENNNNNNNNNNKEGSVMTVGSSHCGSNQVTMDVDTSRVSTSGMGNRCLSVSVLKNCVENNLSAQKEKKGERETLDTGITSSSGGSGSSFGKTCNHSISRGKHKRKARDGEESECQSEAAALESPPGEKPAQKSGSSRRSRAAEVHNLSERRRRDRINEKMKALQELIPHSNKADKASMLDEAIEYMKSLQLQLQMLWMGGGMAPMMFPGVQHYMSRMGMGMAPPALPPIHGAMHLPRLPLVDQAMNMPPAPNQAAMCPPSVLNAVNIQNQLRSPNFSDQYGSYHLGFHPMQGASQQMNMFGFGSSTTQQNSMLQQPSHSNTPSKGMN